MKIGEKISVGLVFINSTLRALAIFSLLILTLTGCTTIGFHKPEVLKQIDFGGQYTTVRICALLDEGVSREKTEHLLDKAWQTEANLYKINFKIVQSVPWKRTAFAYKGILLKVLETPLDPPCDRIMAFVGRNLGDFLYGLLLPEVLGAVNDSTLTHGFTIVKSVSLNQVLLPPENVLQHELYHMLGCEHLDIERCYERIALLKHLKGDEDFFPAWSLTRQAVILSRKEANRSLHFDHD
jgi:hypothetical protein